MYVMSGGQYFKPANLAQTNLAIQSKAAGSGWVDLMMKDVDAASQGNPNFVDGYLMDGGAIIANPDGYRITHC